MHLLAMLGKFVTIRQFRARDTVKSNQNKDKVHEEEIETDL